jgi:HK97 family phage prohead protease
VHEPLGKPGGPGLFHHKGLQLPAYIQHVAHHLVASGHDESRAIEMAVGIVKNWGAGHDGHGNRVHPDVQAAAARNIAQWEADKARGSKTRRSAVTVAERADSKAPYGDVPYGDPGYLDANGNQASKSGKPGVKRYPLTADKVMAAWSYINQEKNASQYTPDQLKAIKGRIRSAMSKHGHDVSDSDGDSDSGSSAARSEYMRLYPLENIEILRSESDDSGRGVVVEAYAAVFDQPAEIKDHEGHYVEEIDRAAFDTAIAFARRNTGGLAGNVKVLYNHGLTMQGTPAPEFQLPIGVPIDIRPEKRGLLTRTRYHLNDPFTARILENIRAGSITAQSFTGRIIRSNPQLSRGDRYRPTRGGDLPTVRRIKLGLREYGPVLWAAYTGAEILGVRMSIPGGVPATDKQDDAQAFPPDGGRAFAGDDALPEQEHSARYHQHRLYLLRSKEIREKAGLVW